MTERIINTGEWIERWSYIQPEKTAVYSNGVPYSYRALNERINKLTHILLAKGIRKGDRVAVLLHNCLQYVEIFFAVSKIGGILVPLNWRLAMPELEFIIKDSRTRSVIFEEEFLESAVKLRDVVAVETCISCATGPKGKEIDLPDWIEDYETLMDNAPAEKIDVPYRTGDNDPHILMYTSGTTGLPKGAVLSHKKTFFNVLNAGIYFDLTRHDIAIIARPLFHSGGLIVELAPVLYKGGTVIIQRRFSPEEILKTVERYRVTILELPATVYNFILHECEIERYDLSTVKCFYTGGERVSTSLLKAFYEKGIVISQIYGLTEASTLFWLPYDMAHKKMGSVGKPVFHADVRIVDERGMAVPPGGIGEIIVKGPVVMNGYWERPDLTKDIIKNSWLHTGDLATMDEEGFVYIVDRKKDMFISGGENVYPAEVEKALLSHPDILDAAVIGVEDERWGEVGKAFIILKPGKRIDEGDINSFLNERLARYKIPKYIEFVDRLPKTASGKIRKSLLK
ncbi:MAG TPA: long-chain fatty acid--CoA ligase [Syntrophorhabdaceae bacterium]|nr:long-chain fatty acid--CoA ligase [Syntrophorhabdaceae bacterium]HOL05267.1 long-chain fatty acid--CoA ligase [Syntrophorhabdaceae bacterium]HPP41812.1 long-chain fatty acid--CoA ligase [Syntrophorhabdaceae bacterium]